jgi:hypothetical protein
VTGGQRMDMEWEDRVRERAYALWEREGRPEGGAERHWAQAEEELRAEEQRRAGAPIAEAAGIPADAASTAGTETWPGPGGPVGGSLRPGIRAEPRRLPRKGRRSPGRPGAGPRADRARGHRDRPAVLPFCDARPRPSAGRANQ